MGTHRLPPSLCHTGLRVDVIQDVISKVQHRAAVGARERWDASWGDSSKGSELDSSLERAEEPRGGHPHHEGPAQGKHRHDCRGGKTQTQLWQRSGNLPQITSSLSRGHSQAPSRPKEKLPAGPGAASPSQCHPGLATSPACTLPRPEPPAPVSQQDLVFLRVTLVPRPQSCWLVPHRLGALEQTACPRRAAP